MTKKPVIAWAGFSDGRIDSEESLWTNEPTYCIYRTRKLAERFYVDVRKVEIREAGRNKSKA